MSCPVYDIENSTIMHVEMAYVRRLRAALETIRDTKQTAAGARLLATHALQDGHTVAALTGGVEQ